jgi:hypothetical protein
MDMRFDTWNVRSLYRSGSFKTVARELGKYKLDLVGVQEVRWDKVLVENPKERDHWKDQGVGGKMGSESILGRLAWGVWIGFDCLKTGTDGGLL